LTPAEFGTLGSGVLVGGVLGLVGGGGSVLAVPLLVYGVGVSDPHIAIGTSAIAVSISAFTNLRAHARAGNVKWRCAGVFTLSGMLGAFVGSSVAKWVDGYRLLALFGVMMVVIGASMLRAPRRPDRPDVRLTRESASELGPRLVAMGLGVGLTSGFFGIGGGFLAVPGLIAATAMPMISAVGTSLVSVAAFGATTGINYALSGLVDVKLAAVFIVGATVGGYGGVELGKSLSRHKHALRLVFVFAIIAVGLYVVVRGLNNAKLV
jgi:uncharacterized protein